jgi:Trk-type K+ transport system membrane component
MFGKVKFGSMVTQYIIYVLCGGIMWFIIIYWVSRLIEAFTHSVSAKKRKSAPQEND